MITATTKGLRRFFADNPKHLGLHSIEYEKLVCQHLSPHYIGVTYDGDKQFIVKVNSNCEIQEINEV